MSVLLASVVALSPIPADFDPLGAVVPTNVMVYYDDLDLRNDAGVRHLYRRLKRAVATACPIDDARNLAARVHSNDCRKRAREQVAVELDRVVLAARAKGPSLAGRN